MRYEQCVRISWLVYARDIQKSIDKSTKYGKQCSKNLYESQLALQYSKLCIEFLYIEEEFQAVYGHFLSAIDHMKCHPTLVNTTRGANCVRWFIPYIPHRK